MCEFCLKDNIELFDINIDVEHKSVVKFKLCNCCKEKFEDVLITGGLIDVLREYLI